METDATLPSQPRQQLLALQRVYGRPQHFSEGETGAEKADNNFRTLRILTALMVAATHCLWVIYGFEPDEKDVVLNVLMQASHCGICIFFGLSGYLITQSLMTRPDFLHFTISRILRLCPLVIFSALLMGFVAGPFFSTASFADYYGDWRLWAYVPLNAVTYSDLALPGLFETAPAGSEINVSLWTLKYEVMGYIGLAMLAAAGLLTRRFLWVIGLIAIGFFCYVSYFTTLRAEIAFMQHGLRFGFAFLIGALLYGYRDIMPLNIWGVLSFTGLAIVTNSTPYMEPFRIIALTYAALWIGTKPISSLLYIKPAGDYSYGIFVFHWPIAQMVLQLNPGISYGDLLLYVMPMTFGLAVLSWNLIERPVLESRPLVTDYLRQKFAAIYPLAEPGIDFGRRGLDVMSSYHENEAVGRPPRPLEPLGDGARQNSASDPLSSRENELDLPPSLRPQASGYVRRVK